jgi:hypothetical protein
MIAEMTTRVKPVVPEYKKAGGGSLQAAPEERRSRGRGWGLFLQAVLTQQAGDSVMDARDARGDGRELGRKVSVGERASIPLPPCLREDMPNKTVPGRVTPHRKPNKEMIGEGMAVLHALDSRWCVDFGLRGYSDGLQDGVGLGRKPDIGTIS